jgi:hypothetical protein
MQFMMVVIPNVCRGSKKLEGKPVFELTSIPTVG